MPHVRIGQEADLVVVAPATADLLARAVAGRADDLLTATLLTARCPVLFAPAMHTEMWFHPATVDNVATLRRRGAIVLEPASGPPDGRRQRRRPSARGRGDHHARPAAAGPRRRAAVRHGRREGAGQRGRHPRAHRPGAIHRQPQFGQAGLRDGPGDGPARRRRHVHRGQHRRPHRPGGCGCGPHRLGRPAKRRRLQARARRPRAGDGRRGRRLPPDAGADQQDQEGRRSQRRGAVIELTRTDDVLAGAVRARTDGQLPNMRAIVGFAAETGDANGDVLFHARAKLQRKGCDLLVVNAVGENRAFEVDNNDGWLLASRRHGGRPWNTVRKL